jgi:WD40 repeat protein
MVSSEFHYHCSLEGHRDSINALVFSGDDRYLASAADDGLVQVFDCETWKSIRRLQGVAPARAIVWHPTPNSHNAVLSVGFRNGDVNTVQLKKVSVSFIALLYVTYRPAKLNVSCTYIGRSSMAAKHEWTCPLHGYKRVRKSLGYRVWTSSCHGAPGFNM